MTPQAPLGSSTSATSQSLTLNSKSTWHWHRFNFLNHFYAQGHLQRIQKSVQGSGPFHSYHVEKFLGRSSEIAGLCGQVQCHGEQVSSVVRQGGCHQHTEASQHLVVCPVTFPPSFLITSQSIEFYWSLVLLFFHLGVAASAVSSFVTLRSFDRGGVRLDIYPFLLSYLPTCPLCLPLGQVKGFCFQPVVPQIISLVVYSLLTRLG